MACFFNYFSRKKHRYKKGMNTEDNNLEKTNTTINVNDTINEYVGGSDWRINANSNTGYSNAGLINQTAGKVVANYWLTQVYNKEEAKAHIDGSYHIHDLDSLSGYCCGHNLQALLNEGFNGIDSRVSSRPPKHFREALNQMANFIGILQAEWAGAQAFSSFDTFLAPHVFFDMNYDGMTRKQIKQAIRNFVYNLNVPSRWGQCVPSNYMCLKSNGEWTTYHNLKIGDEIYVIDTNTGEIKTDVIKKINLFDSPEKMHRYQCSDEEMGEMSFDVTDNHKVMIIKDGNFILKNSSDILNKNEIVDIPFSANFIEKDNENKYDENFIELISTILFSVKDLSWEEDKICFEIIDNEDDKIFNRFRSLCVKNNLEVSYEVKHNSMKSHAYKISLSNNNLANTLFLFLSSRFVTSTSLLEALNKNLSKDVCEIFINNVLNCYGNNVKEMKQRNVDTYLLLNVIGLLCVKCNMSFNVSNDTIFVTKNKSAKFKTSIVDSETKKVWCPTTDTGTFICKTDKGLVFLTGNSPFSNVTIDLVPPKDLRDSLPLRGDKPFFISIYEEYKEKNPEELNSKNWKRFEEAARKRTKMQNEDIEEVFMSLTYGLFKKEMEIIDKAFYEVLNEGDSDQKPFTFPIPTINITEDFDWNSKVSDVIFENTAKYGSSYFQNFIGSQYKIDENGNKVLDEGAYKPDDVRSMAFIGTQGIIYKDESGNVDRKPINYLVENWLNSEIKPKYKFLINGKFHDITEMFKINYEKYNHFVYIKLCNDYDVYFSEDHKCAVMGDDGNITFKMSQDVVRGDRFLISKKPWGITGRNETYEDGLIVGEFLANQFECKNSEYEDLIKKFIVFEDGKIKRLDHKIWNTNDEFRIGVFESYVKNSDFSYGTIPPSETIINEIIVLGSSIGKLWIEDNRITENDDYYIVPVSCVELVKNNLEFVYNFTIDTKEHLVELPNGIISHQCCRLQLDKRELRKRGGGLFGSDAQTGCYDEETEVLTHSGWKKFADLTDEDEIYTLSKNGTIELHKPSQIFTYDYDGDMIKFYNDKCDLLVTPNHNMALQDENGDIILKHAEDCTEEFTIPMSGRWSGNLYSNEIMSFMSLKMDSWIKMLSSIIGSSAIENNKVRISFHNNKRRNIIEDALQNLPINIFSNVRDDVYDITINDSFVAKILLGGNSNSVPKFVYSLPSEIIEDFINNFVYVNNNTIYDENLMNQIQHLCVLCGKQSHVQKNGDGYSFIKFDDYENHYTENVERQHYTGKVYCVEVENHVLCVRRNGKTIWCGNSIGVVTINMARLGYEYKNDKKGLYKRLYHLMDLAKSTLEKKRKYIMELMNRNLYPYSKRYVKSYDTFFSTIGVNGINEMIRNFTNDEHDITDDYGQKFADEILTNIRERLKKYQEETGNLYNLEATPAEGCLIGTTKILTENGLEEIEKLAEKEVNLMSYNIISKKNEYKNSKVFFDSKTNKTYKMILSCGLEIEATHQHPFAVYDSDSDNGFYWVPISLIKVGDILVGYKKNYEVVSITCVNKETDVYNATVNDNQNFYIGDENNLLLTHNTTYRFAKEDLKRYDERDEYYIMCDKHGKVKVNIETEGEYIECPICKKNENRKKLK